MYLFVNYLVFLLTTIFFFNVSIDAVFPLPNGLHLLGMTARGRGTSPVHQPLGVSAGPAPPRSSCCKPGKSRSFWRRFLPSAAHQNRIGTGTMGSAAFLLAFSLALIAVCSGGSDAPRGVAVGFVFDPNAKCEPACRHAGLCIRNNTCFCAKGYEGETCQHGDVPAHFLHRKPLILIRTLIWCFTDSQMLTNC